MPNLINILRQARQAQVPKDESKTARNQTDEERRADVARLLRGETSSQAEAIVDMEWGTCMVFSCVQDCCRARDNDGKWSDVNSAWKNEFVLVQWDS